MKNPIIFILSIIAIIIGITIGIFFLTNKKEDTIVKKESTTTISEFPISGKGVATLATPVKAYLDPLKSHTTVWGKGHTKFVLASDPSVYFICACKKPDGGEAGDPSSWWAMPAGEYLVYPYGVEKIQFSWY